LFFASKNHHNFFLFLYPIRHPPLLSHNKNYQIFHQSKNWEKSILCPISPPLILQLPLPAINKTIFKFNSLQLNCATAFFCHKKTYRKNNIFGHSLFQKAILNHHFSLFAYYKTFLEKNYNTI